MVRNYIPTKSEPNEEAIKQGLKAIQDGDSVRKAAKTHGIAASTLFDRLKKSKSANETSVDEGIARSANLKRGKYSTRQVFTDDQEEKLKTYLLRSCELHYGLTLAQTQKLAYQYAVKLRVSYPKNWDEKCAATYDWSYGFMKRHPELSLRKPENTSLARASGFNPFNVNSFMNNLEALYNRHRFTPERVYNLDETGVTTVMDSPKVIAKSGIKQVGKAVAAERGELVTVCCIVNAIGNTVPPAFVFPRVHFREHMLHGAPPGSLGLAFQSGWMTGPNFLEVMKHFVKHTRCDKENPVLLILDNHESHIYLEAVLYAKENGVVLLTFPPHCSHKMQPLDISVYGPFKAYLRAKFGEWQTNHPHERFQITHTANLVGQAYPLAFTPNNITSGFSKPGIWPFSRSAFTDADFIAAKVSDRPNTAGEVTDRVESRNTLEAVADPVLNSSALEQPPGPKHDVNPEDIFPFPKAKPRKLTVNRARVGKTRILTDTPEKEDLEKRAQAKSAKKTGRKRVKLAKSKEQELSTIREPSSPSEISFHDSSDESLHAGSDCEIPETESEVSFIPEEIKVDEFVLVRFQLKKDFVLYAAKILETDIMNREFQVSFLRRKKDSDRFHFPDIEDKASVSFEDVVKKLEVTRHGGTARVQATYVFAGLWLDHIR
jgi:hypothetical protein